MSRTRTITGSHTATLPADPADVFDVITDVDALPTWNARMRAVVEQPTRVEPGAEWVVELHALGQTWRSRSVVDEIDRRERRFTYRSATDDGNPSEARWAWEITPVPDGAQVTVKWDLHPVTFWRRVLLARIRARQLAAEVPASLAALAARVGSGATSPTGGA